MNVTVHSTFFYLVLLTFLFFFKFAHTEEVCTQKETEKENGKDNKKEQAPPRIGNFALPISQQPAGLFSFGGNIIEKNEVQLYLFGDEFEGKRREIIDLIPSILFGITDELTLFFNYPFTPSLKDGRKRSHGIQDFFVQLEYEFYEKKTTEYENQATVVGNVTAPTGSIRKNPPTGFGSPSFFIGGTFYHVRVDWFAFATQGAILTTTQHGTKVGDQFLYQCGLGRNIPSPEGWIYAWMVEFDGQYSRKNRDKKRTQKDSGGNVILATPSLWISSKELLFQFGVSFPLQQNLFGKQNKIDYALNFNLAWSFYP